MKIRKFLPLLHIEIEIPFVSIWTEIMSERAEEMERTYLLLGVKLWKWQFRFELYDTYKRIYRRKEKSASEQAKSLVRS